MVIKGIKYKITKDAIFFLVNGKIYPQETILNTAFIFIDRAYVFLDGNPGATVRVYLKSKNVISKQKSADMAGEFYNELLNQTMRNHLLKQNKQLREFCIGSAMLGAINDGVNLSNTTTTAKESKFSNGHDKEFDKLLKKELKLLEKEESAEADPLDILIPWGEKNKKTKKQKK